MKKAKREEAWYNENAVKAGLVVTDSESEDELDKWEKVSRFFFSLYKTNMICVCVCVCTDLTNRWTDMVLLYSVPSHWPCEGL